MAAQGVGDSLARLVMEGGQLEDCRRERSRRQAASEGKIAVLASASSSSWS